MEARARLAHQWRVKTLLQRALNIAGFDVRRVPDKVVRDAATRAGLPYELIRSNATYAPWLADEAFRSTLAAVRAHTLVDEYRLYELWSLVRQTAHLAGDIVEVGVWRGGSGTLIAKSASVSESRSRVFLCDTFAGVVKASSRDSTYRGGEHADASRAVVEELIGSLRLDNVHVLQGIFPDETGALIADARLRFCHIDVDVYESTRDILHWVWERLVVGGVIVFDDYGSPQCDGVIRLVEQETTGLGRIVIYNLNGHAVMVRTS